MLKTRISHHLKSLSVVIFFLQKGDKLTHHSPRLSLSNIVLQHQLPLNGNLHFSTHMLIIGDNRFNRIKESIKIQNKYIYH